MPKTRTSEQTSMQTNEESRRPLIKRYARYDHTTLEDLLAIMAANIEDAFLMAGAEPGKDYAYRDCFTLAAPFALAMFQNKTADITFAMEWPEYLKQHEAQEQ